MPSGLLKIDTLRQCSPYYFMEIYICLAIFLLTSYQQQNILITNGLIKRIQSIKPTGSLAG
jgi:hypothetical protein